MLQDSLAEELNAVIIQEAAHHLDFYGTDSVNDPAFVLFVWFGLLITFQVTEAREEESDIIIRWIAQIEEELANKL